MATAPSISTMLIWVSRCSHCRITSCGTCGIHSRISGYAPSVKMGQSAGSLVYFVQRLREAAGDDKDECPSFQDLLSAGMRSFEDHEKYGRYPMVVRCALP